MAAFLVITARVTDPQRFAAYASQVPALMQQYGGRYRVHGGSQALLEGADEGRRVVISEWPDRAAALAFWHSPAYAALKALRAGCGEFEVRLVDTVPVAPEDSA